MGNKTLTHKGYCGSIEVSLEDGCLHGKILFINDLVTYEAETIPQLTQAFNETVDFYLRKCAQEGLRADKPFSGSFNVRTGSDLHRKAAHAAYADGLNLNEFVLKAVEVAVDRSDVAKVEHTHNHFITIQGVVASETRLATEATTSPWEPVSANTRH